MAREEEKLLSAPLSQEDTDKTEVTTPQLKSARYCGALASYVAIAYVECIAVSITYVLIANFCIATR